MISALLSRHVSDRGFTEQPVLRKGLLPTESIPGYGTASSVRKDCINTTGEAPSSSVATSTSCSVHLTTLTGQYSYISPPSSMSYIFDLYMSLPNYILFVSDPLSYICLFNSVTGTGLRFSIFMRLNFELGTTYKLALLWLTIANT